MEDDIGLAEVHVATRVYGRWQNEGIYEQVRALLTRTANGHTSPKEAAKELGTLDLEITNPDRIVKDGSAAAPSPFEVIAENQPQ